MLSIGVLILCALVLADGVVHQPLFASLIYNAACVRKPISTPLYTHELDL